jgi:dTDP-4-dehydrorhamnose 3,5-epimerase
MPFKFTKLEIRDLILIKPAVFIDQRGFFMESYKESEFIANGINYKFSQDNHSLSKQNVLRGLHYQLNPKAQGKLVRVIKGSIWDVAVDIRKNSPTYLKWIGIELSEQNNEILFIPPGFAHGFVSLTDDVHLTYKCTNEYAAEIDCGIRWDDPDIGIKWPVDNPVISDKDLKLPYLKNAKFFD